MWLRYYPVMYNKAQIISRKYFVVVLLFFKNQPVFTGLSIKPIRLICICYSLEMKRLEVSML